MFYWTIRLMLLFHLVLKVMSSIQKIVTPSKKMEQETFILLTSHIRSFLLLIKKRKEKMENFEVFCFYQKKMLINTCNLNLDDLGFLFKVPIG